MINKNFDRSKATSLEKLNEIIIKVEAKTQIARNNLIIIFTTSFLLIWFGIFDIYLSYVLTTYFPIIWSLKLIGKKEIDDHKQWLSFWVIYSFFVFLDMFSIFIIKLIPFYFIIRTVILLWCYCPGIKGSLTIYKIAFVHVNRIIQKLKILEKNKNDSLKSEVEKILEQTDQIDQEILPQNFEANINKKNN
jgi:hypothetical protein